MSETRKVLKCELNKSHKSNFSPISSITSLIVHSEEVSDATILKTDEKV